MATSYQEATTCPRCKQPGDPQTAAPMPDMPGYQAMPVYCRNENCVWFDTMWIVQINPDGTIPDAAPPGKPRGEKMYGLGEVLKAGVTDQRIAAVNNYIASFENRREV